MKARVSITLLASEKFSEAPKASMTIDTELKTAPSVGDSIYIGNFYGFDWEGTFDARPAHHMFVGQLGDHLPLYRASVWPVREV